MDKVREAQLALKTDRIKVILDLHELDLDIMLEGKILPAGLQTYRAIKHVILPCPTCDEDTEHSIDGEWATGIQLTSGYTPPRHELVRNHITRCNDCDEWEAS